MRRLVLVAITAVAVALIWAPVVQAADGSTPSAGDIAGALVLAWGVLAPLTIYKWIPLNDAQMKLLTMGAALIIGLVALVLAGQLSASSLDLTDVGKAIAAFSMVYGESQFVWTLLKDHPSTTKLVT